MKSPCTVTYTDMIKEVERELSTRKNVYPRWQLVGRISGDTARHRIEIMETLLRMLKRYEPKAPEQLNLFDTFQTVKRS